MKFVARFVAVALIALSATACVTNGQGMGSQGGSGDGLFTKQNVGTLLGAVGGGVAGAQFGKGKGQLVGVAAGTLLGAVIGNSVGASLDRADASYAQRNNQNAFETGPSGRQYGWRNPDSGNAGVLVPQPAYQNPQTGQFCREFTEVIYVGGQEQQGYGTACRQPDGSWKIVSGR